MDLVVFEENKARVLQALERGEFDYVEGASEYVETEFFRFIGAKSFFQNLADTYPTPRKKQEVPVWLYIASNLSMRLHGVDAFHAFPMVVRTGGLINAFASKPGQNREHLSRVESEAFQPSGQAEGGRTVEAVRRSTQSEEASALRAPVCTRIGQRTVGLRKVPGRQGIGRWRTTLEQAGLLWHHPVRISARAASL